MSTDKLIKENLNNQRISSVRFTEAEIAELKAIMRNIRESGYCDYISNPTQFKIYRKLGLGTTVTCHQCINFDQWIESCKDDLLYPNPNELTHCKLHATWMTIKKEMSDVVNTTYWCDLHIGKLKESR